MLDQNTDRMWFVIGAVIVGAAIIFIANGSLPTLFASVADSFEDVSEDALMVMDDIGMDMTDYPNVLNPDHLAPYEPNPMLSDISYDHTNHVAKVRVSFDEGDVSNISRFITLHNEENRLVVPYGESYTYSYEIKSPVDITLRNDINVRGIDGVGQLVVWNGNNNDHVPNRRINNLRPASDAKDFIPKIKLRANKWTRVSVTFENTSPLNKDELDIMGALTLGFFEEFDEPIDVELKHIKGEFNKRASTFYPYGVAVPE